MKASLLFCLWLNSVTVADMPRLRALLQASYSSKASAVEFLQVFSITRPYEPLLTGYNGMAEVMMCNYVKNPFSKLSYFHEGTTMIDEALKREPDNVELHFLRFAVQSNAPVLLNYRKNIEADKKILLEYLRKNSSDAEGPQGAVRMIRDYMRRSGYYNN
jgi:hypothetical protein